MKRIVLAGVLAVGMLTAAPMAGAVTIDVTTAQDDYGASAGSCSLREAVTAAQSDSAMDGCAAGSGADVISLPGGDYGITRAGSGDDLNVTGDFDILGTGSLTIRPADAKASVVVNGKGLDRVFDQQGMNSLAIENLQITGGLLIGINDGGGILNGQGMLSLEGVTVSGNSIDISGGGVAVYGNLTMLNSTISGNSTKGRGGGLYFGGGSSGTVRSSTITGNTADADSSGGGDGGGGFADSGATSLSFYNVIDAANQDLSPMAAAPDCQSKPFYFPRFVVTTQALGPVPCLVGFSPGSNQVVSDAMLGPLAQNGGQTPTHALLAGSPAIGAGGASGIDQCPAIDQTGRSRPAGGCDIGAVQYVQPPLPAPPPPAGRAKLKIVKIKPKSLKLRRRHRARKIRVVFQSKKPEAKNLSLCLKLKGKSKRAIKVRGKRCLRAAVVDGRYTKKFKLAARRHARTGKYRIKVVLDAANAKRKTGKIVIKIK